MRDSGAPARLALAAAAAAAALAPVAAAAAAAAANSVCFSAPYDPATCLSWTSDATNITFTANWPVLPNTPGPAAVGWGGWGISQLTCGSMFPSSVWMAIKGPGGVRLEDRSAVGHVLPQCRKEQLSHVTAKRVEPDGSFSITWTRPLVAPKSSGQPSIVPGNISIIGAVFFGPLDLRPCESMGIPGHQTVVSFTAQLIPSDGAGSAAATLPSVSSASHGAQAALAPAAPVAGLIAAIPVCSSVYSNFAQLSPAGLERFYGASSAIQLLPGVSTVDVAGRRLYSLLESASGVNFELVSINVDSGVRSTTVCKTDFYVSSSYPLQNVNIAWDANNATVIVAGCTDPECAGYVGVSRIDPVTCASKPVVKAPTDPPLSSTRAGGSAFDPATDTFVMTIAQAAGKKPVGPVLVSIDMRSGKVLHTFVETGTNVSIIALTSAGPGRFLGVNEFPDLRIALATLDSALSKVSLAPAVPNCVEALAGASALVQKDGGDVFYFLSQDGAGGATRIIGVFAANGTVASTGLLPGDASLAPPAFFVL